MAIDFTQPVKTGNYDTGILGVIRANTIAVASFLDGVPIVGGNVAGLKRYNASTQLFEKSDGTNWTTMPLGYVPIGGGTMSGPLLLSTDPIGSSPGSQAASKSYVLGTVSAYAPLSALAAYAPLSGASFTGSINTSGNVYAAGSISSPYIATSGAGAIVGNGTVYAANGTLTASGLFYMGQLNASIPFINFGAGSYLGFDRGANRYSLVAQGVETFSSNSAGNQLNGNLTWASTGGGSYGGNFHLFNNQTGGGPYMRVNGSNGLEIVNAGYSAVSAIFGDNGSFTSTGLLYGRNGGAGLGQIIVQQGGSPSGGAPGDLWFIY